MCPFLSVSLSTDFNTSFGQSLNYDLTKGTSRLRVTLIKQIEFSDSDPTRLKK